MNRYGIARMEAGKPRRAMQRTGGGKIMDYRGKVRILNALPSVLRKLLVTRRFRKEIDIGGEPELVTLRDLVQDGDLCIDIGANMGVYSYELGRLSGNVYVFEPNPVLADFIDGLTLDGVKVTNQVAISSSEGVAQLVVPGYRGGHQAASLNPGLFTNGAEVVDVATRTLDSFGFRRVRFIKIDVEGFEEEVLAGSMKTIADSLPILLIEIEERHNAGGLDRILATLSDLGYAGFFYIDDGWKDVGAFDRLTHQNPAKEYLDTFKPRNRRETPYFNNFLFVSDRSDHKAARTFFPLR